MRDQATAIGYVQVVYLNESGDVVRTKTFKNRLTYYAVSSAARLWLGEYVPTPTRIVLGTGAPTPPLTGPSVDDTALWTADATTERACDIRTTFLTFYTEFGVNYTQGELTGTVYTEAGLFDEDGNMWAHAIIEVDQQATETAVVLWKVQHVGN